MTLVSRGVQGLESEGSRLIGLRGIEAGCTFWRCKREHLQVRCKVADEHCADAHFSATPRPYFSSPLPPESLLFPAPPSCPHRYHLCHPLLAASTVQWFFHLPLPPLLSLDHVFLPVEPAFLSPIQSSKKSKPKRARRGNRGRKGRGWC